ncbi:hypothetical protein [Pseudooceanicola sp. C21-150M6]|uniref:hypothetical protein n=1 Tax=Pseudooceanicola sp. C21-150M6 TaxID=3434355 RepID=UPI003D7FBEC4
MYASDEPVRVDQQCLTALVDELGADEAGDVLFRAMEELAVRLSVADSLYTEGQADGLKRAVGSLCRIAGQIGLHEVCRVGADVTGCLDAGDPVAVAATFARLQRVCDRSLTAIWDMQTRGT